MSRRDKAAPPSVGLAPSGGTVAAPSKAEAGRSFRLIIAGGGVAGLGLACMLERVNKHVAAERGGRGHEHKQQDVFDYVLLEGRDEIAPELGANIAILASGQRVLQQLGLLETLDALSPRGGGEWWWDWQGKTFLKQLSWNRDGERRFGYGCKFAQRRHLLRIMYDSIEHKERIVTGKRVSRVVPAPAKDGGHGAVRVETADGASYEGDLAVGADGIYSAVRREMWRIAEETSPGLFGKDYMKSMKTYYSCAYGLYNGAPPAKLLRTWVPSDFRTLGFPGAWVALTGAEGDEPRLGWGICKRLPRPLSWEETPPRPDRTRGGTDRRAFEHGLRALPVADATDLVMGDLFDATDNVYLTPMHEGVLPRWHFGRTVVIGEAAHKSNPVIGQGGNMCLETAAALVNALLCRLDPPSPRAVGAVAATDPCSCSPLSDAQVDAALAATQRAMMRRAKRAVARSRSVEVALAGERPWQSALFRWGLATLDGRALNMAGQGELVRGAVKLDRLPGADRPHYLPYDAELPAAQLSDTRAGKRLVRCVRWATAGLCLALVWAAARVPAVQLPTESKVKGVGTLDSAWPVVGMIDGMLAIPARGFVPLLDRASPEQQGLLGPYFMAALVPFLVVWTVEANRLGTKASLLGWMVRLPMFFWVTSAVKGAGMVAPIWSIAALILGTDHIYFTTTGRIVDEHIARALAPAVLAGYLVPTGLLTLVTWPSLTASTLWQLVPVFFGGLVWLLAALSRRLLPGATSYRDHEAREAAAFTNVDVAPLRRAYALAFAVAAAAHVRTLAAAVLSLTPGVVGTIPVLLHAIPTTLSDASHAWRTTWREELLPDGDGPGSVAGFLWWNLLLLMASALLWSLYSVWELRRLGYVRTVQAVRAGSAVLLGSMAVGPAATYAGVWWWREGVIAGLSRM